MSYFRERTDEKETENMIKSRNSIKNRNNSILISNKIETNKDFSKGHTQSRSSLIPCSLENAAGTVPKEDYNLKVKELNNEKQLLLSMIENNEKELEGRLRVAEEAKEKLVKKVEKYKN